MTKDDGIKVPGAELIGQKIIPMGLIERNKKQPRKFFDEKKLMELAVSIQERGLLEPIALRIIADDKYMIILGERRWRAHKLIDAETIRADIYACDEAAAYAMSAVENLHREDINLLEEADSYDKMKNEYGYSLKQIQKMTGKSVPNISNIMSILRESKKIMELASEGKLSLAYWVWVKQLPNNKEKLVLINRINNGEIAYKEVQDYVHKVKAAYALSDEVDEVDTEGILDRKRKPRTTMVDGLSLPDNFKYYYVSLGSLDPNILNFLPEVNLLVPAYGLIHDKTLIRTTLKTIVNHRDIIKSFFCDSGGLPAIDRKDFKYFDHQEELLSFYDAIQPDICTALDVPTYPKALEAIGIGKKQMLDKTIRNAEEFIGWNPKFKTVKVFVTQGRVKDDHMQTIEAYKKMGVFHKVKNLGIAVGGQARSSPAVQQEIGKAVVNYALDAREELHGQMEDIKLFHFFGVGSPTRIVGLYKVGFNSFDSTSPDKASVYNDWMGSDNKKYKNLLDSTYRFVGPVRRLFNWVSLWIRLDKEFKKME